MIRRAFSLMELMLVVVLIGIIYAMALSSFKPPDTKDLEAFSLKTLPKYLRENFALQDAKLVCFEPCGKCNVLVDGEWNEEPVELFESQEVRSYSIDKEGFSKPSEFAPHDIQDAYKEACFILHKRSNDTIEPNILEVDGAFLYYKAGFEEVETYKSLSAVQSQYQQRLNMIRNEQ